MMWSSSGLSSAAVRPFAFVPQAPPKLFDALANRVTLVLGSARSGTTWLAKILDSHPDVLYRHEPDEMVPPRPGTDPRGQVAAWLAARGARTATKQPFFQKSWQRPALAKLRETMAVGVNGLARLPVGGSLARTVIVPDFIDVSAAGRMRAVIKLVNWDGSAVLNAIPDSRCLFILRHPCGHVASILKGEQQRYFNVGEDGSGRPFSDDQVMDFAAAHGVHREAFASLPAAAKHAWMWLYFNVPLTQSLANRLNARIVLYEALCRDPISVSRDLFDFTGLSWQPQTQRFLETSTNHTGASGYFEVFRTSSAAAERWRHTLSPDDQQAVREAVRRFPIAAHWPDICA